MIGLLSANQFEASTSPLATQGNLIVVRASGWGFEPCLEGGGEFEPVMSSLFSRINVSQ